MAHLLVLLALVHGAQPACSANQGSCCGHAPTPAFAGQLGSSVLRLLSGPDASPAPLLPLLLPLMASATSQPRQVSPPHSVLSFAQTAGHKHQRSQGSQREISHTLVSGSNFKFNSMQWIFIERLTPQGSEPVSECVCVCVKGFSGGIDGDLPLLVQLISFKNEIQDSL